MPLSEMYPMAKGKCDSTQDNCSNEPSFIPENDFVELVWENGQIMMQSQSSRARKNFNISNSVILPYHETNDRVKDLGTVSNSRTGKFENVDSVFDESPFSVPTGRIGLSEDEDVVPWLNYAPVDGSLQHVYGSDIFPEISGVTGNETFSQNNFPSIIKRCTSNKGHQDLHSNPLNNHMHTGGRVSKVSVAANAESVQLYPFSSEKCQASVQNSVAKVSESSNNCTNSASHLSVSRELTGIATPAEVHLGMKPHKPSPSPIRNNSSLINFSHFARPAALCRINFQTNGAEAGSGILTVERTANTDKGSAVINSNPTGSTVVHSTSGLKKDVNLHCEPIGTQSKFDSKPSEPKGLDAIPPKATCEDDPATNNNNGSNELPVESSNRRPIGGEKHRELVRASSSVCSGNSVEKVPDDHKTNMKRKFHDTEESACRSEDVEAESETVKKLAPRASNGSKRSRAAEVHNLSERRRRDRINEKMRALQELIPNCNKVDKASMLDEAIEYLKTLQFQVQMMSMGAGLYMPPMMLPTGMQHINPAHMAHFMPMGVGMGMGYGMGMLDMTGGSSGCPMVQFPPMQGAHFSSSPMLGPQSVHGMPGSNLQMFGHPSQGFPMPMPHAHSIPLPGGPHVNLSMGQNGSGLAGQLGNLGPISASSSRDSIQNINPQVMRSTAGGNCQIQTSNQCETTNVDFEHATLMQNRALDHQQSGAVPCANSNGMVTK